MHEPSPGGSQIMTHEGRFPPSQALNGILQMGNRIESWKVREDNSFYPPRRNLPARFSKSVFCVCVLSVFTLRLCVLGAIPSGGAAPVKAISRNRWQSNRATDLPIMSPRGRVQPQDPDKPTSVWRGSNRPVVQLLTELTGVLYFD